MDMNQYISHKIRVIHINRRRTYLILLFVVFALFVGLVIFILLSNENWLNPGQRAFRPDEGIIPEEANDVAYIYGGSTENGTTVYGFGLDPSELTSPGPTLRFNLSSTVYVRFQNYGSENHTWAITEKLDRNAPILFDAQIGTNDNPIPPLNGGEDLFEVTQTGSFYYIDTLPGHLDQGMWGRIEVISP